MSKYIHPDKVNIAVSDEDTQVFQSHQKTETEVFVSVRRAYGYLSNTVTKLIYDQFGIPGLIMYEKQRDNFKDLVEDLRNLDASLTEEEKDSVFEEKRRELEYVSIQFKLYYYFRKFCSRATLI